MTEKLDALIAEVKSQTDELDRLRAVAIRLYRAAQWKTDGLRPMVQGKLWEDLRDALKLEPGGSATVQAEAREHTTRYSDSSRFDEICTACGATDASGDMGLKASCPGPRAAAFRPPAANAYDHYRDVLALCRRAGV